ncbi:MAG: 50S ribosomal protein L23 [Dehalococcoidia bacterium]|nr:50S ribosomal protein L23 [Dehalococcoidia bacterium]
MEPSQVLIAPLITEKSTILQERGKYAFQVDRRANKVEIKSAVEATFDVKVVSVNVIMVRGKSKRFGPRFKKRPDTKKALVSLRPGDRIQIIEGV